MDRVKTLFKYALWLVLFIIFSNFLINVGLNSTYKPIERKDNVEQVNIYQAEATLVNGRIRGLIKNTNGELSGKYVKIDFYSERDVLLGSNYVQIGNEEEQSLEVLFKQDDVKSYEISIVAQKEQGEEISIIPKDLTTSEIVVATVITLLIFW